MNDRPEMPRQSKKSNRTVRISLFVLGILLAAYALSDHPLYGGAPGFGATQGLILFAGILVFCCGFIRGQLAEGMLLLTSAGMVTLPIAEWTAETALGPRYRGIYQLDDRVLFKFIPERRSTMTRAQINGGDVVSHAINSDGFRGPELQATGASKRIVIYGDSFIHASYSPWEETFAAQLQGRVSEIAGESIEVINAGVSSYGPDQILLKMETELPQLDPDLVVVSIFAGNDFGDLLRNKLFKLDASGNLLANSNWHVEDRLVREWELRQRTSILKRALGDAVRNLRSITSTQESTGSTVLSDFMNPDFLVEQAEREYRDFVINGNDVVTNTHIDYYSANINLTPFSDSARFQTDLMRQILTKIASLANANDASLIFLFIPHPYDVAEDYDDWGFDHSRYPDYDSRNQIRILEDAAQNLNVPFLSLYDVYQSADANQLYFHGGDDHWNAAGQSLAAELMSDSIRNLGVLNYR